MSELEDQLKHTIRGLELTNQALRDQFTAQQEHIHRLSELLSVQNGIMIAAGIRVPKHTDTW